MVFTTVRDFNSEHLTRRKMTSLKIIPQSDASKRPRFSLAQVLVVIVLCALVCGAADGESSTQNQKYFSSRHGGRLLENNKLRLHPSSREFSYPQGSSRAKTLQRIISQRRRSPLRESGDLPPIHRFTYSSEGAQLDHRDGKTTHLTLENSDYGTNVGDEAHFSQRSGRTAGDDTFHRGMYDDEDAGRSFALGSMIEQLSSALHRSLVRNRSPSVASEGRRQAASPKQLSRNDNRVSGGGLGGGNEHYSNDPQKANSLPECATQQVCNAVYVRLNMTQPLCSCPALPAACSASLSPDDKHTIELKMGRKTSKAVTLIKTCEPVWSVRDCRAPRDWSILALQNTRTGKAHYLVICKCPDGSQLDGPLNHDQPSYAQVPGIRVYGMMCVSTSLRAGRHTRETPSFPWSRAAAALADESLLDDLLGEDGPIADVHPENAASNQTELQRTTAKFLDLIPEHELMELEDSA